jgi:hypothetical protein
MKLVQEGAGNMVKAIRIGKDFLGKTQVAKQLREIMDKLDDIKLKSFCTANEIVSKLKRPPTEWRKSLPDICQIRNCLPEYTGSSKTKLPKNQ